ncbi:hypothetical protein B1H26_18440 [Amycolatopsis sp. BJA-103]|nr:hypothetical protein BKN51_16070 [Amycolatopsis sp. BJA-103]PNE16966.1 hypothetical protein B1H26_18440 [Amycolatopsis sp. BJA-103]
MDLVAKVEGPEAGDELRSLHEWLGENEELRGRVRLSERPPEPGTLGPVLDALVVALGPAGAATAIAATVLGWLRTRRSEVRVKLTLPGRRTMEIIAKNVADLDAAALQQQLGQVVAMLEPDKQPPSDQ